VRMISRVESAALLSVIAISSQRGREL
jgi:hypothetical protein